MSVVIGVGLLWFSIRNVPLSELLDNLARVPWYAHAAYLVGLSVQFLLRCYRFSLQLPAAEQNQDEKNSNFVRTPTFREIAAVNAVGFAAVFFLPFRLGEFVRPHLASQKRWMRKSAGLGVSAVERIVDGIVTTGFFGGVMLLLRDRDLPSYVAAGGWLSLLVFGGASVVLMGVVYWREKFTTLFEKIVGLISKTIAQKIVGILDAFLLGLASVGSWQKMLLYVVVSILYWFINGVSMWLLLDAMVVDSTLLSAFFCLSFLVIGVMLPAPPGNIGNFHAFAKGSLVLLGAAESSALAYAVALHLWQVIFLLVCAAIFLNGGGMTWRQLEEEINHELSDTSDETGDAPIPPTENLQRTNS